MKKILFLNTTKLAVLSAMLLLAVFCTIGMSFTPAEEGENVGNPNDSTYVTGPRRSHWSSEQSGTCGTTYTYYHEKDYARVEARVQVHDDNGRNITDNIIQNGYSTGEVRLSFYNQSDNAKGTVEGGGIIDNIEDNYDETNQSTSFGTAVYLNWNCGINDNTDGTDTKPNPDIDKTHKLDVTLTATHWPNSDYIFAGWYLEGNNNALTSEKDTVLKQTITIGGGGDGYTSYHSGTTDIPDTYDTQNRYTVKYYALYKPAPLVELTFIPSENGSYTYKIENNDPITVSEKSTVSVKGAVILSATAADKYKFFGWYELIGDGEKKEERYFSYEATETVTFIENTTIYAKFIPEDWATYIVKEKPEVQYYDFQVAADAASNATDKVFLPITDGIVPYKEEGYTIPSGVTLLIPYNDENTVEEEQPTVVDPAPASNCKPYRTLTLTSGTTINVNGAISVSTKQYATNTTYTNNGVRSWYGFIYMNEGSIININKEANLYAWGYISGEGEVIAKPGSFVHEMFQVTDFRGGSRTIGRFGIGGGMINNSKKVFFFQSYYIQNIETKLIIENGAILKVAYAFNLSNNNHNGTANFIGTKNEDAMFTMSSGKIVRKYNWMEDRIHYTLEGECELKYVSVSFSGVTVTSENYVLPLNSNMDIKVTKGSSFTITQDMSFLPNTKVDVEKDATITINADCNVHIYDTVQWIKRGCLFNGADIKRLAFVGRNHNNKYGAPYPRTIKDDAKFNIDGTLIVYGALYTTQSGADICSTGTGEIIFNKDAGKEQLTYQDINNDDYQSIPITAALLHNGEEWYKDKEGDFKKEYLATENTLANTTITYANHHWGWMEIWKDHDGTILNINNTCTQTNNSSAYEHNVLPEGYTFIGWSTEINETNQEVIHTAQYTFGPELDIVDADGTNLTINANGWASSGWPYTVSVVTTTTNTNSYEKTARQSDRTLKVPYSGDLNADMQIIVTNTSGTVSNHIYKVPFVYTSDATLSGTDESSIVFVKSGTLTVGTASAKEIYVAPGAELKVNGTLTVGKLVLRTKPYEAAILTNNGTINGQVFYSRISPDSEQYYQFGLPLSCPLASVQMSNTGKLGGSKPKYGTAWMLKSYNEESRANNGISNEGANWELLESTGTITAGVGYEMFSNSNYYREFYFPVNLSEATNKVSVQYTEGTKGTEHNGWNIITSPLTSRANVPIIGDPATAIKVCWLNEDGSYRQEQPTVIPPAIPFSYQASVEGELNFSVSTIAAAPRKQSAGEALTETEWIHLDIFDAYGEGDETSLFVHPTRFEQTYKTGIDVAKQSLTAARPIMYSTHAYGDMAFAGVADSLLENGIDLVVYSPSAQELTFSLRENKFLNRLEYLWLADNETGARTDLLMNDYTFRADAGTAKGRFVLNGRFKAPQISTGIGNTQTDYNIYAIGNNIAISGVEQGTPIYVFDAVGHMIYTTTATTAEVIVPAPCAGVYMLSVGGQTAKLVINQ